MKLSYHYQAGQWLNNPLGETGTKALIDAKNEILLLQKEFSNKEEQVKLLHMAIVERDKAMQLLVSQFNELDSDYKNTFQQLCDLRNQVKNHDVNLKNDEEIISKEEKHYEELKTQSDKVLLRIKDSLTNITSDNIEISTSATSLSSDDSLCKFSSVDVEKQLELLRGELDEFYGGEISKIKECLLREMKNEKRKYEDEINHIDKERTRYEEQTKKWQNQYMLLSQQNISSSDLVQKIGSVVTENTRLNQQIDELNAQLHVLSTSSVPLKSSMKSSSSLETSEETKLISNKSIEVFEKGLQELERVKSENINVGKLFEEKEKSIKELKEELEIMKAQYLMEKEVILTEMRQSHEEDLNKIHQNKNEEIKNLLEEKERLVKQVTLWQHQYIQLSHQNLSSTDLVKQISSVVTENMRLNQLVDEFNTKLIIQSSKLDQPSSKVKDKMQKEASNNAEMIFALKKEIEALRKMKSETENYENQFYSSEKLEKEFESKCEMYKSEIIESVSLEMKTSFEENELRYTLEISTLKNKINSLEKEKDTLSKEAKSWQDQYFKLSQQNITESDYLYKINSLINENSSLKQLCDSLKLSLSKVEENKKYNDTNKQQICDIKVIENQKIEIDTLRKNLDLKSEQLTRYEEIQLKKTSSESAETSFLKETVDNLNKKIISLKENNETFRNNFQDCEKRKLELENETLLLNEKLFLNNEHINILAKKIKALENELEKINKERIEKANLLENERQQFQIIVEQMKLKQNQQIQSQNKLFEKLKEKHILEKKDLERSVQENNEKISLRENSLLEQMKTLESNFQNDARLLREQKEEEILKIKKADELVKNNLLSEIESMKRLEHDIELKYQAKNEQNLIEIETLKSELSGIKKAYEQQILNSNTENNAKFFEMQNFNKTEQDKISNDFNQKIFDLTAEIEQKTLMLNNNSQLIKKMENSQESIQMVHATVVEGLKQKIKVLEADLQQCLMKLKDSEDQLAKEMNRYKCMHESTVEVLTRDHHNAMLLTTQELNQLQSENGQLKFEITTHEKTIEELNEKLSSMAVLQNELQKVTKERDSAIESLQNVYSEKVELKQSLDKLESQKNSLNNKITKLNEKIKYLSMARMIAKKSKHNEDATELAKFVETTALTKFEQNAALENIDKIPASISLLQKRDEELILKKKAIVTEQEYLTLTEVKNKLEIEIESKQESSLNVINVNLRKKLEKSKEGEIDKCENDILQLKKEKLELIEKLQQLYQFNSGGLHESPSEKSSHLFTQSNDMKSVHACIQGPSKKFEDKASNTYAVTTTDSSTDPITTLLINAQCGTENDLLSECQSSDDRKTNKNTFDEKVKSLVSKHDVATMMHNSFENNMDTLDGTYVNLDVSQDESFLTPVFDESCKVDVDKTQYFDVEQSPLKLLSESRLQEIEKLRSSLFEVTQQLRSIEEKKEKVCNEFKEQKECIENENNVEKSLLNDKIVNLSAELDATLEKLKKSNQTIENMYQEKEKIVQDHSLKLNKLEKDFNDKLNELTLCQEESENDSKHQVSQLQKQLSDYESLIKNLHKDKTTIEQEFVFELQEASKENDQRVKVIKENMESEINQLKISLNKTQEDYVKVCDDFEALQVDYSRILKQMKDLKEDSKFLYIEDLESSPRISVEETWKMRVNALQESYQIAIAEIEYLKQANEELKNSSTVFTTENKTEENIGVEKNQEDVIRKFINASADEITQSKSMVELFKKSFKQLRDEKEALAKTVTRLIEEKDQLLVTMLSKNQCLELDLTSVDLESNEDSEFNSGNINLLENEKEVLASMLAKLNVENKKLRKYIENTAHQNNGKACEDVDDFSPSTSFLEAQNVQAEQIDGNDILNNNLLPDTDALTNLNTDDFISLEITNKNLILNNESLTLLLNERQQEIEMLKEEVSLFKSEINLLMKDILNLIGFSALAGVMKKYQSLPQLSNVDDYSFNELNFGVSSDRVESFKKPLKNKVFILDEFEIKKLKASTATSIAKKLVDKSTGMETLEKEISVLEYTIKENVENIKLATIKKDNENQKEKLQNIKKAKLLKSKKLQEKMMEKSEKAKITETEEKALQEANESLTKALKDLKHNYNCLVEEQTLNVCEKEKIITEKENQIVEKIQLIDVIKKDLTQSNKQNNEKISFLEVEIAKSNKLNTELNDRVKTLSDDLKKIISLNDERENALKIIMVEKETCENRVKDLISELAEIKQFSESSNQKNSVNVEQIRILNEKLSLSDKKFEDLLINLNTLGSENDCLKGSLAELQLEKQEFMIAKKSNEKYIEELNISKHKIDLLETSIKEKNFISEEKNSLSKKLNDIEESYRKVLEENNILNVKCKKYETELANNSINMRELEKQFYEQKEEIKDKNYEIKLKNDEIKKHYDQRITFKNEISTFKSKFSQLKSLNIQNKIGIENLIVNLFENKENLKNDLMAKFLHFEKVLQEKLISENNKDLNLKEMNDRIIEYKKNEDGNKIILETKEKNLKTLLQENSELKSKTDALSSQITCLTSVSADHQKVVENLQNNDACKDQSINQLQNDIHLLKTKLEEENEKYRISCSINENNSKAIHELKQNIEVKNNEILECKKLLNENKIKLDALNMKKQAMLNELEVKTKNLEECAAKLNGCETQLSEKIQTCESLKKELNDYKHLYEEKISYFQNIIKNKESDMKELKNKHVSLSNLLTEKSNFVSASEIEINDLKSEIEKLTSSCSEKQKFNELLKQKVKEQKDKSLAETEAYNVKIKNLTKLNDSLNAELEKSKASEKVFEKNSDLIGQLTIKTDSQKKLIEEQQEMINSKELMTAEMQVSKSQLDEAFNLFEKKKCSDIENSKVELQHYKYENDCHRKNVEILKSTIDRITNDFNCAEIRNQNLELLYQSQLTMFERESVEKKEIIKRLEEKCSLQKEKSIKSEKKNIENSHLQIAHESVCHQYMDALLEKEKCVEDLKKELIENKFQLIELKESNELLTAKYEDVKFLHSDEIARITSLLHASEIKNEELGQFIENNHYESFEELNEEIKYLKTIKNENDQKYFIEMKDLTEKNEELLILKENLFKEISLFKVNEQKRNDLLNEKDEIIKVMKSESEEVKVLKEKDSLLENMAKEKESKINEEKNSLLEKIKIVEEDLKSKTCELTSIEVELLEIKSLNKENDKIVELKLEKLKGENSKLLSQNEALNEKIRKITNEHEDFKLINEKKILEVSKLQDDINIINGKFIDTNNHLLLKAEQLEIASKEIEKLNEEIATSWHTNESLQFQLSSSKFVDNSAEVIHKHVANEDYVQNAPTEESFLKNDQNNFKIFKIDKSTTLDEEWFNAGKSVENEIALKESKKNVCFVYDGFNVTDLEEKNSFSKKAMKLEKAEILKNKKLQDKKIEELKLKIKTLQKEKKSSEVNMNHQWTECSDLIELNDKTAQTGVSTHLEKDFETIERNFENLKIQNCKLLEDMKCKDDELDNLKASQKADTNNDKKEPATIQGDIVFKEPSKNASNPQTSENMLKDLINENMNYQKINLKLLDENDQFKYKIEQLQISLDEMKKQSFMYQSRNVSEDNTENENGIQETATLLTSQLPNNSERVPFSSTQSFSSSFFSNHNIPFSTSFSPELHSPSSLSGSENFLLSDDNPLSSSENEEIYSKIQLLQIENENLRKALKEISGVSKNTDTNKNVLATSSASSLTRLDVLSPQSEKSEGDLDKVEKNLEKSDESSRKFKDAKEESESSLLHVQDFNISGSEMNIRSIRSLSSSSNSINADRFLVRTPRSITSTSNDYQLEINDSIGKTVDDYVNLQIDYRRFKIKARSEYSRMKARLVDALRQYNMLKIKYQDLHDSIIFKNLVDQNLMVTENKSLRARVVELEIILERRERMLEYKKRNDIDEKFYKHEQSLICLENTEEIEKNKTLLQKINDLEMQLSILQSDFNIISVRNEKLEKDLSYSCEKEKVKFQKEHSQAIVTNPKTSSLVIEEPIIKKECPKLYNEISKKSDLNNTTNFAQKQVLVAEKSVQVDSEIFKENALKKVDATTETTVLELVDKVSTATLTDGNHQVVNGLSEKSSQTENTPKQHRKFSSSRLASVTPNETKLLRRPSCPSLSKENPSSSASNNHLKESKSSSVKKSSSITSLNAVTHKITENICKYCKEKSLENQKLQKLIKEVEKKLSVSEKQLDKMMVEDDKFDSQVSVRMLQTFLNLKHACMVEFQRFLKFNYLNSLQ